MSTAQLQAIGSAHQARYGENFDQVLADLISACHKPDHARITLDERTLLGVLVPYASSGLYDPADPPRADTEDLLDGLVQHRSDPSVRLYRYTIHYSPGDVVDVVTFAGASLRADQTVIGWAEIETITII